MHATLSISLPQFFRLVLTMTKLFQKVLSLSGVDSLHSISSQLHSTHKTLFHDFKNAKIPMKSNSKILKRTFLPSFDSDSSFKDMVGSDVVRVPRMHILAGFKGDQDTVVALNWLHTSTRRATSESG